jgi:hypothetical protein
MQIEGPAAIYSATVTAGTLLLSRARRIPAPGTLDYDPYIPDPPLKAFCVFGGARDRSSTCTATRRCRSPLMAA